jgi:Ca2+-binding EF-hand superfamily protein
MHYRLLCSALLLVSAGLPFSPALAQRTKSVVPELDAEGHKGDMVRAAKDKANERFNKADADSDGWVTREEATASLPFIAENFEKYDKNKDGKMSWEEYVGHDKWKREPAK